MQQVEFGDNIVVKLTFHGLCVYADWRKNGPLIPMSLKRRYYTFACNFAKR